MQARQFTCSSCAESVTSRRGWPFKAANGPQTAFIYICPNCKRPTFFTSEDDGRNPPVVGVFR